MRFVGFNIAVSVLLTGITGMAQQAFESIWFSPAPGTTSTLSGVVTVFNLRRSCCGADIDTLDSSPCRTSAARSIALYGGTEATRLGSTVVGR
jgi:hypothetical protein